MNCGRNNDNWPGPHHLVYIFLNGIVVTDIYCVQVDGEVDVCPHIMVSFHMMIKPL